MYVRENFMYHPRPVRQCQKPASLICKHLCLKNHQRTHQTLFILKPIILASLQTRQLVTLECTIYPRYVV